MRLFIKLLTLTHPNRIVLLNANIDTILDIARTMMIHMHIVKYLWYDAMLSSCHLINRMPSSILNDQVLFSYPYPTKNSFSITRVFGCTCFVQDLCPGLNKLFPRSIKQFSKWRPQRLHRSEKFIEDGDISGIFFKNRMSKSDFKYTYLLVLNHISIRQYMHKLYKST